MCDNIDVKGCSNLYGEGSTDGIWLCNGCISSFAQGEFFVANGPSCRMPVFGLMDDRLKKGMCSTDDAGTVHQIRKCIGCLITNKPCAALPKSLQGDLTLLRAQLDIIYRKDSTVGVGDAKFEAMRLAQALRKRLDSAPFAPHHVNLRWHNGSTDVSKSALSAVRLPDQSKSKAARKSTARATQNHLDKLTAEKEAALADSPSGRGKKRQYDDSTMLEALEEAEEDERTAKDALTDHMGTARPSKGKARANWDKKKERLTHELEDARDKVHEIKNMQKRFR